MRLLLGLAALTCLGAGWNGKAFPDWNDDAVMRMLVDSPWAHTRTVRILWYGPKEAERAITYRDVPGTQQGPGGSTVQGGSPVGGIGSGKIRNRLPERAHLIFRWSSALPVRQAKALYRARDAQKRDARKKTDPGAVAVEPRPSTYAFEIFGIPAGAAHVGTEAIAARLKASASMRTKSGREIRPERVSIEVSGDVLSATVYFPRDEALAAKDEEVEVSGNIEILEFSERFRLRDMQYVDGLEL
ncbi:MAG: hypothetical protein U0Q16_38950 [Bryobacteraceae bacterium]